MFKNVKTFSGFSVDDIPKAKQFYGEVLGLDIEEMAEPMAMLVLHLATGADILIYPKGSSHTPAGFTILNFPVENIDDAVEKLRSKGVEFVDLGSKEVPQDEKGVMRGLSAGMGPDIAWFKDPAGNTLSVLQETK